jgi:hypothetical protein
MMLIFSLQSRPSMCYQSIVQLKMTGYAKNVFSIQCKDCFRGGNFNHHGNHCDAALRFDISMWL